MARAVMLPLAPGGGMRAGAPSGRPMKAVAADFIKPSRRLTSFERLEIYNRQYWFRLKDCLYDDYPGLRAVLGDRRFERLACAYLARHPSQSFSLRNLGRRLAGFLESEPRWTAPHEKPALDMARLEWAHVEAYDNEAKPPLEAESLLAAAPARLRLKLQPHITLLHLDYELDGFLIQIRRAERLRTQASNALEERRSRPRRGLRRRLRPKPLFLAVHRPRDAVHYKRLEPGQFRLLSGLQANATVAGACQAAAGAGAIPGDFAARLKSWFETWAALGWFCRLR